MIRSSQILVVSADEDLTRTMSRTVIELGYGVSAIACEGEGALIAAAETPTALALVDVQLPGAMDGVGVGKVLQKTLRLPFIYVTEKSDVDAFRRARLTHPHGYLLKPVDPIRLRKAIELALQRASLESEVRPEIEHPPDRAPSLRIATTEENGNGGQHRGEGAGVGNGRSNGSPIGNGGGRNGGRNLEAPRDLDTRDPLTLLDDGKSLEARARKALESSRDGGRVALVLIDLVNFSDINDELGKRAGDEILEQVARRLQLRVQPRDVVARLGGDRFGVLFTRLPDPAAAHRSAGLLLDAFGPAFHAAHWPLRIKARVALAAFPDHARDARELLESARRTLESVKDRQDSVLQICESAVVA